MARTKETARKQALSILGNMSQSSGEAKTTTMEESYAVMTIPAPLMRQHAEGDQKGAQGTRRRQTQKARLAALEAEINELRAWKARMAQKNPSHPIVCHPDHHSDTPSSTTTSLTRSTLVINGL